MKAKMLSFIKEHAPALIIFLVLSLFYSYPVLEGRKIVQMDIIQSLAMQGEMKRYEDNHNEHILWTNAMFSGMPTFQLRPYSHYNFLGKTIFQIQKALPNPVYLLFFCLTGMYILCIILGINRWLSIIAAIAFAFGSYNIISIEAGHTSKVRSIALMAPLLAGIIITLRGKLIVGGLMTAIFAALQITSNHPQITYYVIIIAGLLFLFEMARHIKEQKMPELAKASGVLAICALIALACNISTLLPTYEYSKETIRGGFSELSNKQEQQKGGGLDKDYAFAWSQGIMESLTFLVPNFSGGASGEALDENSATYKTLVSKGVSPQQSRNIISRIPTYWGNQPFTAGPMYFGATVIFLLIFGFLTTKHYLRWWLLGATLLALLLSWGKNFPLLSDFFFDYVPLYNKFRTPSMMLAVVQLMLPVVAALGLNDLLKEKYDIDAAMRNLKISGGITLGACLLLFLGSSMFSYAPDKENSGDKQYYDNFYSATNDAAFAQDMVDALKKDREKMMTSDAVRSFVFIALAVLLMYLLITGKIKQTVFVGGIALLVLVDLWGVDKRYLNDNSFAEEADYKQQFRLRDVDRQILQDPDLYFRVHDITADPFNNARPSYFHKTIGGYHAAKLQRYQDMIERHISKGNMNVLNMLNTKYFIVSGNDNDVVAQQNRAALGNAWTAAAVKWVNNADEEMDALTEFNPDSLAVIDVRYKEQLGNLSGNLTKEGTVQLTNYHPDKLTYNYESGSQQLVIFSEVFYRGNIDWKSYIDGIEAPHVRVNYLLRGLLVPAGKHEIVFEFRPDSYYTGEKITLAANLLIILLVAGYGISLYRNKQP
jgi:hypothetical protein